MAATRKERFPREPRTKPSVVRPDPPVRTRSGEDVKGKRAASEAPTMPPPGTSGDRPTRRKSHSPMVREEVTADLSKDPRAEKEDE